MNIKRLLFFSLITIMLCGLLSQANATRRVLNIVNLQMRPNPFTPHSVYAGQDGAQGLRISFKVESRSKIFWLTTKVYNLQGSLVRTIKEMEVMLTDAGDKFGESHIVLWWDGRNDHGQYARNGRYIVHVKISDTEAEAFTIEKLRPVVLVK